MYGKKLKENRIFYGLSKMELAKAIKTSHQNITRWEEEKAIPSIENCVRLADYYGITLDELIGREIKKNW